MGDGEVTEDMGDGEVPEGPYKTGFGGTAGSDRQRPGRPAGRHHRGGDPARRRRAGLPTQRLTNTPTRLGREFMTDTKP